MREQRITQRYSQAFQLKVVGEIESDKRTINECRKLYDIAGSSTIQKWLRRHGRQHLLNAVVYMRMKDEADKLKQLQQRIAQLERALAASEVEKFFGIGAVTARRLKEMGITTGADLQERSEEELAGRLASRLGKLEAALPPDRS